MILDEAYCEFALALGDTYASVELLRRYPNLVLLRTFSKVYGLAGLRVGYALCGSEELRTAVDQLRQPFYLNAAAQAGGGRGAAHQDAVEQRVTETIAARLDLEQGMRELGLWVAESDANFIWLHLPEDRDEPTWSRVCASAACWSAPGRRSGATARCGSRSGPTPRTSASSRRWASRCWC